MNARAALLCIVLAGCAPLPTAVERLNSTDDVVPVHHVASFRLEAVTGDDGFPSFRYENRATAPTVRVSPGDTIAIALRDRLARGGMEADINLHFHGLGVSPQAPSDDVLTMLAEPGQTLHYVVHVPSTQPPGLYWYHPHVHGETENQVGKGGMSGAIVVAGIEKHFPVLAGLTERILMVREVGAADDVARRERRLKANFKCAPFGGDSLTVNDTANGTLHFVPGKPAFFGIVNATSDRTLDLQIDGVALKVVAVDGFPVDTYAGSKPLTARHFVLPPAGRVEFVARLTSPTVLRTLCYDSGPAGDPDPAQQLLALTPEAPAGVPSHAEASIDSVAEPTGVAASLPPPAAHRAVNFGENAAGTEFYINGRAFEPSAPPMFVVHTGTVERWTVSNFTDEVHAFHIHQTHFLVTSVDGVAVKRLVWSDTVVVPWQKKGPKGSPVPGTIEALVDFRSSVIRGTFLFHCHILNHEDHGMMAKIQAL